MSDPVRLWCLRHAESENVIGGIAGAVPLAQLTPAGRAQAVAAGVALAAEPIVRVYTSTALRARQTGALLSGSEVSTMPGLVEVGIGAAEGSTDPRIRQRTADVLHTWVVLGDLDERVADGETGHEVLGRMTAAFETLAAAHAGETVAVVGHVASLTVVLALLCGLGARVWGAPLGHAEPFLITGRGGSWECPTWPVGQVAFLVLAWCLRSLVVECSTSRWRVKGARSSRRCAMASPPLTRHPDVKCR